MQRINLSMKIERNIVGVLLVLIAISFRFFPHQPNFTPLLAIFVFSSGYFKNKKLAFFLPLIVMFISDLIINNIIYSSFFERFVILYTGAIWTYTATIILSLVSIAFLKKFNFKNILMSGFMASIIFFIISNFGVWFSTTLYPKSIEGLMACYFMGLPFFKNTLFSTILFVSALYGVNYFLENKLSLFYNIKK